MIVMVHVIIALASLAASSYSAAKPSRQLLRLSYGLVIMTLASGTILVLADRSVMVQACASGLLFSAASLGLAAIARRRLAGVQS